MLPAPARLILGSALLGTTLLGGTARAEGAAPAAQKAPATATTTAGALGKLPLAAQPTELLAGRLRLRLPAGAKIQARRAGIMSAPESAQEETRVVLDAGPERLVLMAAELLSSAPPDLLATVRKSLDPVPAGGPQPNLALQNLGGLQTVLFTPAKFEAQDDAVLLLTAYVVHTDNLVQVLEFYVNPAGARDLRGVQALARNIAATLQPGATRLPGAGPATLSSGLAITLPAGYVVTRKPGPDFVVHNVHKIVPWGQPRAYLGIYVGGHASFAYRQRDETPDVKKTPGQLLGQKIEWQEWSHAQNPGLTTLEAIVPLGGGASGHGLMAHVFFSSKNAAQLAELKQVAETLRLTK